MKKFKSSRELKESIKNMEPVLDNNVGIDAHTEIDVVMADAIVHSAENDKHIEEVKDELNKKAEEIATDNPDEGKVVKNAYTAPLKLDESLEDFILEALPKGTTHSGFDARKYKVMDQTEDKHLDFDMYDFILCLVSNDWPKPLNPFTKTTKIRKFEQAPRVKKGEIENIDDYVPQVGSDGESVTVMANDLDAFSDIIDISRVYEFKTKGPSVSRNAASYWKYSFTIYVPMISENYPMLVADYFEGLGMTMYDVLPAPFAKTYYNKLAKIQKERTAAVDLNAEIEAAITAASRDNTRELEDFLNDLYTKLDDYKVSYDKEYVEKTFMDAFADDYEDEE